MDQQSAVDRLRKEAAARLSEAMDESAAIALLAVEKYGAQLQPFCKQVCADAKMPDAWKALESRAIRRREKSRSGHGSDIPSTPRTRQAKYELKQLVESDPDAAREIALEVIDKVGVSTAPRGPRSVLPPRSLQERLLDRMTQATGIVLEVAEARDETCEGRLWVEAIVAHENALRLLQEPVSVGLRRVK